jgi:cyanophycinase
MSAQDTTVAGTLALVGGGEWGPHTRDLDARLLADSGGTQVVVLPTAAAYEHPDRVGAAAAAHFAPLGATVTTLGVLHRREAEDDDVAEQVRDARFVYLADGSPLHLRSVLKGSALLAALLAAYRSGAVVAASGAGATVLCDPMVDPRGGAYTVGLGFVENLAVFPYHGTAADHLRERSIDLLPRTAQLVGIDAETALIRSPDGTWSVAGAGAVTVYEDHRATAYPAGTPQLPLGKPA